MSDEYILPFHPLVPGVLLDLEVLCDPVEKEKAFKHHSTSRPELIN